MDLELIKDIYNLHIRGFEGLGFNVIRKENYEITYNKSIDDYYSNFISNFDVRDNNEFEKIINESNNDFRKINKDQVVYLIPFMKELYNNKSKYFNSDDYELVSTEAWQIYNDFSKLNDINTNCKLNVKLEVAKDMNEFADYVISCYKTDEKDDPYGELDEGYSLCYKNYKQVYNDIKSEFYYIKVDNKIVGTTQSVYNNKICGIYSLALKKEYRKIKV